ncbi:MAG: hypothetical protein ACJ798_15885 [Phenylobacterium sp.]
MRPILGAAAPATAMIACLALGACNKTDTAPRPEHSDVATAMPDAATTPGALGPATTAPHAPPPATGAAGASAGGPSGSTAGGTQEQPR